MLIPGKPFQPSLFVGKARTHRIEEPSSALLLGILLALDTD